jgi:iron complex outermembrane receptor protein
MPPKRQNVGTFRNKGIEFSTSYNINKQWQASANYTFLDLKKPILAAPRHQVNFNLNYQYKILNVNANLQHIHKLYVSVSDEKTQNYTLLNMRISAKVLKQLELFASVHNILNQKYEINYGYPMPGINFHGGLNFNL